MYDNDDFDFGTDLGDVEATEFDTIPAGKYPMQCVSLELADTTSGGKMVKTTFEVISGEFANSKIFENYNVQNANSRTVNIALGQIKQWLSACGIEPNQRLTMNLLRQLEGREFLATVYVSKDKYGAYPDQNRIRKYEELAGASHAVPAQAPRSQTSATAPKAAAKPDTATGGKMPWQV